MTRARRALIGSALLVMTALVAIAPAAVRTLIGSALLVVTALVATASVLVHARVDWRATTMGRHLMLYMSVIATVFDLSVARLALGDPLWLAILQLVVFVGVPVAMIQRLYLQVQAQRADREVPAIELLPLDDDPPAPPKEGSA